MFLVFLAKFTEAANFGGNDNGEGRRDRKTVIEELISDSKMRKAERSREHEEMIDLTSKLDSNWKELFPVVEKLHRRDDEKDVGKVVDDYDRLVKEMVFMPRGEPTQKLRSEEEVARTEKERLERLESERLDRMRGDQEEGTHVAVEQPKYRSADDLGDDYYEPIVDGPGEMDRVLSYPIHAEDHQHNEKLEESRNESDEESQEDEEIGSDEESDADSLNDLKEDSEEEDESEEEYESAEEEPSHKVLIISSPAKEKPKIEEVKAKENEEIKKKVKDKTEKELEKIPYTIEMPNKYEELMGLIEKKSPKVQGVIIDRIIKTNPPKLLSVNQHKMGKLFVFLLQYTDHLFTDISEDLMAKHFKILDELSPFMFDLMQMNPKTSSEQFLEVIKEKYNDFQSKPKSWPKVSTLVFFKLLGAFFSVSDFRHPVVTPTLIFINRILSESRMKTRSDIASGLFLVTLLLDFQKLSKKFMPSAMNFLCGVFYLGVKKSSVDRLKPLAPFFSAAQSLLVFESKVGSSDEAKSLKYTDFVTAGIDDDFKSRALTVAIGLNQDFLSLFDDHVGMKYLAANSEKLLSRLHESKIPTSLKSRVGEALKNLEDIRLNKKLVYPIPERRVQPMLRMLEPRVETVLTDRRQMFSQSTGAKLEQQKLKHMIKREFKSAKRELRRDNEFISKIRHKRMEQSDLERKAKVKRIFNEASIQQSEYKATARTKGRKSKF